MKELQGQAERLQHENDQLRAQINKIRDLGKDVRDSGLDAQAIPRDKGKGLVALGDVDTPVDDELSSGSSPSLNLSLVKNTRESTRTRSSKRPSPHPAFSDAVSGASRKVRRELGRQKVVPVRLCLKEPTKFSLRHVATSVSCTSCLWYIAYVLRIVGDPISETC